MATESADGPDLSETLPASLEEWLDERAAEHGIDRSELLIQLVSAYRATSELDDDPLEGLFEEWFEDRLADAPDGLGGEPLEDRDDGSDEPDGLDAVAERVEALEATHREDVEDVRKRVLQLRDAVRDRAPEDHEHDEVHELSERLDGLASDLEDVGSDVADLTDRVDRRDDRLADVESKLDRLAGVVLALRDDADGVGGTDEVLEHIRVAANRRGVRAAACVDCGRTVQIPLLTRPACPHCGTEFRDLEEPGSVLGRWLDVRKPKLVGAEPPALGSADE